MNLQEIIRRIRQDSLLSQQEFAKELGVSYATVSRWEGGRAKPNWTGIKLLKNFCIMHHMEYSDLIEAWSIYIKEC